MKKMILLFVMFAAQVALAEDIQPTKVFLIRHAPTEADGSRDPALSAEGKALAQRWASVLASEKVTLIYSTDYKRTQATAAAIAARQGDLAVISYDLGEMNLEKLKAEIAGKTVVIVGHSNTTPMVANGFLGDDQFAQFGHDEYGTVIIVQYVGDAPASAAILHLQ